MAIASQGTPANRANTQIKPSIFINLPVLAKRQATRVSVTTQSRLPIVSTRFRCSSLQTIRTVYTWPTESWVVNYCESEAVRIYRTVYILGAVCT